MPRTLNDLTEAEWQMLMILREEAASEGLKITIIAEPGQWHVRLESHEQGHPATVGTMISAVLGKTSSIHD